MLADDQRPGGDQHRLASVDRCPTSGFVGAFVRHQHQLDCYDPTQARTVRYQLSTKLFSIHEPYLMKTERDSLLRLKADSDADLATETIPKNGANKKRKRSLAKKVSLLEDNLTNEEERTMAARLVERFLATKEPATKLTGKRLLKHLDRCETDSNLEAQTFVQSLFCNRFESLNYRAKTFANPYRQVLRVKFGLSNYLIPARCSFSGMDAVEGVQMVVRCLKLASIQSQPPAALICDRNPFVLVMDPAWSNRSVKRKRTYEVPDYEKLLPQTDRSCFHLFQTRRSRSTTCVDCVAR